MSDNGIIYYWKFGKLRVFGPNDALEKRKIKIGLNKRFGKPNCKDITSDFMKKATPGIGKVDKQNYIVKNGVKYVENGKNVRWRITTDEKENAAWITLKIGGNIYHIPKVNPPQNVKTADYYWDYIKGFLEHKGLTGDTRNTIPNAVERGEGQSKNLLLDITNSKILFEEGILDIIKVFDNTDYAWVDLIILRKGDEFIVIKRI